MPEATPKIGKTSRHETTAAISPPTLVLNAVAAAEQDIRMAMVACRWAYGTVSPMYASVSGKIAAAAMPVRKRRSVTTGSEVDAPQRAVPTLKSTIAKATTFTLPTRSESGP